MKLVDLNPTGAIGSNCLYLEIGSLRILVDAGLHPKLWGRQATPALSFLEDRPLDLIILTHCHLDHLGALPLVMRDHPNAAVIMTAPSAMLAARMLHNSVNVMQLQRDEKNIPEYPLFTHELIDQLAHRFTALPFSLPKKFYTDSDSIEITLHPAGHVAGAAGVELVHKHRRIFLTGDVLFDGQRTLAGARFPQGKFDTIVMETTRGSTERANPRSQEIQRLIKTINRTVAHGGSVLIPVFALGRQQEILAILHDALKQKQLPRRCPIYSTGLGMDLCDYFDDIATKTKLIHFSRTILKDLKVRKLPRTLTAGVPPPDPAIYVLSSGMLAEKTPSYLLASCLAPHTHSTIAFVGYCDPDTPGGELLAAHNGQPFTFGAFNVANKLRCNIERFELSGHADRDELLEFALRRDPRSIILTHGDPPARQWFADQFAAKSPHIKVIDPTPLTPYES